METKREDLEAKARELLREVIQPANPEGFQYIRAVVAGMRWAAEECAGLALKARARLAWNLYQVGGVSENEKARADCFEDALRRAIRDTIRARFGFAPREEELDKSERPGTETMRGRTPHPRDLQPERAGRDAQASACYMASQAPSNLSPAASQPAPSILASESERPGADAVAAADESGAGVATTASASSLPSPAACRPASYWLDYPVLPDRAALADAVLRAHQLDAARAYIQSADEEMARLRTENERLRAQSAATPTDPEPSLQTPEEILTRLSEFADDIGETRQKMRDQTKLSAGFIDKTVGAATPSPDWAKAVRKEKAQ
jgi:hypothetical protein